MHNLPQGIYEALLDEELNAILQQHPELRSVFGKLDPEEETARYAAFVARVVEKALRLEDDPLTRLRICNELVERVAGNPSAEFLRNKRLVHRDKPILLEITPPHYAEGTMPRPETALTESSLFTGSPSDPQLVHELAREIQSADSVDLLVFFIKWSGLRLLMSAFEEVTMRGGNRKPPGLFDETPHLRPASSNLPAPPPAPTIMTSLRHLLFPVNVANHLHS